MYLAPDEVGISLRFDPRLSRKSLSLLFDVPLSAFQSPFAIGSVPFKRFAKILDCSSNSLFETDSRLPAKNFFCARDIWLAYFRIILRQGLKFNSRFCSGNATDLVGKLLDCHLARIAKVDRLVKIAHCQFENPIYQVGNVA